jgi:hypothetical protein
MSNPPCLYTFRIWLKILNYYKSQKRMLGLIPY